MWTFLPIKFDAIKCDYFIKCWDKEFPLWIIFLFNSTNLRTKIVPEDTNKQITTLIIYKYFFIFLFYFSVEHKISLLILKNPKYILLLCPVFSQFCQVTHNCKLFIHPSYGVGWGLEPILAAIGQEVGYTLVWSQSITGQTTMHSLPTSFIKCLRVDWLLVHWEITVTDNSYKGDNRYFVLCKMSFYFERESSGVRVQDIYLTDDCGDTQKVWRTSSSACLVLLMSTLRTFT